MFASINADLVVGLLESCYCEYGSGTVVSRGVAWAHDFVGGMKVNGILLQLPELRKVANYC